MEISQDASSSAQYRSYHMILSVEAPYEDVRGDNPGHFFVEIQLRTIAMDSIKRQTTRTPMAPPPSQSAEQGVSGNPRASSFACMLFSDFSR